MTRLFSHRSLELGRVVSHPGEVFDEPAGRVLPVDKSLVRGLAEGHRAYLSWYRERVFRGPATVPGEEIFP